MKHSTALMLLPHVLHALSMTWRYRVEGPLPAKPAVLAFWHGDMLPVWKFFSGKKAVGLTSMSSDGNLLAALLERWGYDVVRGSSSQKGKEALEEITGYAGQRLVLITPDGPRGPRHIFKPGAVIAAQRANVPLYLCRVRAAGLHLKKSWDHFLIPVPCASIRLVFSPPLSIRPDATREEISEIIHQCEVALKMPV